MQKVGWGGIVSEYVRKDIRDTSPHNETRRGLAVDALNRKLFPHLRLGGWGKGRRSL